MTLPQKVRSNHRASLSLFPLKQCVSTSRLLATPPWQMIFNTYLSQQGVVSRETTGKHSFLLKLHQHRRNEVTVYCLLLVFFIGQQLAATLFLVLLFCLYEQIEASNKSKQSCIPPVTQKYLGITWRVTGVGMLLITDMPDDVIQFKKKEPGKH